MVTLPTEAADDPALVKTYADRGADVMRINCAHDGPRDWTRMVANMRAAEAGRAPLADPHGHCRAEGAGRRGC